MRQPQIERDHHPARHPAGQPGCPNSGARHEVHASITRCPRIKSCAREEFEQRGQSGVTASFRSHRDENPEFGPAFRQRSHDQAGPVPHPFRNRERQDAAAETLFREGKALGTDGKIAEACPKFEASLELDRSLGTLLNLADCLTYACAKNRALSILYKGTDFAATDLG